MSKYEDTDNIYCYPDTDILKNLLNIKDAEKLELAERELTVLKTQFLDYEPVKGNFDLQHLQKIHSKLFSDIYEWAGKIRTVDISKGDSRFANCYYIDSYVRSVSKQLASENYLDGLSSESFSQRAAFYMGELNAAHPFREGNGRAIRAFIGQLAKHNGFEIGWKNISQTEMTKASIQSFHGDCTLLAKLIRDNLTPIQKQNMLLTEKKQTQNQAKKNRIRQKI